jgi:hypothetical protein
MAGTPQDRSTPDDVIAAALGRTAGRPGPECLDTEELAAYYDRSLAADELTRFEAHVAGCRACQARLVAIARSEPAPAPSAPWWAAWMGSPRRLAWVAPVLVAGLAAAVWYAQRPTPSSAPETTLASSRVKDEKAQVAPEAESSVAEEKGASPANTPAPGASEPAAPARLGRQSQGQLGATQASPQAAPSQTAETAHLRADETAANERPAEKVASDEPRKNTFAASSERLRAGPPAAAAPASTASWRFEASGAISRSDDGGATWHQQATANVELLAGSAVSSTLCWAAGRGGAVWRTTDGEHWAPTASPAAMDLVRIEATDALHATVTAADGRRFETSDGGQTWRESQAP